MKSILNLPAISGVYLIKNTVTNQKCVGSSVNIKKRCNSHRCMLNNGNHANVKLQRSYKKYGADAFSFSVLEAVKEDNVIESERKWIGELMPEFNLREVVETNRGIKLSLITRKKMSLAHKGKLLSLARLSALDKLYKNRIGKPVTGKTKESLRLGPISLIGKPQSEATRTKISESKKGKKFNKYTRKYE